MTTTRYGWLRGVDAGQFIYLFWRTTGDIYLPKRAVMPFQRTGGKNNFLPIGCPCQPRKITSDRCLVAHERQLLWLTTINRNNENVADEEIVCADKCQSPAVG